MTEIEIGRGKRGRRAYSFDDIAIVPSRRTRDPEEVSVSWQIDAYHFDIPVLAAPMDSVMAPDTAIALGRLGGLPVLDLEGLARVEFFLDRKSGAVLLNEVNRLAGFTPISMYPKLWEASGLPFRRLVDRLITLAFERHGRRQRLVTAYRPVAR